MYRIALIIAMVATAALAGSGGISRPPLPGADALSNGSTQLQALALAARAGDLPNAVAGNIWYDSTKKAARGCGAFGNASAIWVLDPTTSSSGTLSNPTAATTFSQVLTLPAGSLTAGRVLRITAFGKYTTGTGLTPTIDLGYNMTGTAIGSSGLVSTAVSLTDKAWRSSMVLIVRTTGTNGTLFALVDAGLGGLLAAAVPPGQIGRSGSFTVNTTIDNVVGPTAKFGVSDASNAITCEGLFAEVLN